MSIPTTHKTARTGSKSGPAVLPVDALLPCVLIRNCQSEGGNEQPHARMAAEAQALNAKKGLKIAVNR